MGGAVPDASLVLLSKVDPVRIFIDVSAGALHTSLLLVFHSLTP